MAEAFVGTWKLKESKNFDEYMAALGMYESRYKGVKMCVCARASARERKSRCLNAARDSLPVSARAHARESEWHRRKLWRQNKFILFEETAMHADERVHRIAPRGFAFTSHPHRATMEHVGVNS